MTYFQQQLLEALGAVALASLLILAAVIMSGCASMFGIPTMPASDLAKALAQSDAACITFPTPWGVGKAVTLSSSKGAIRNGSVKADKDCNLELNNSQKADAPATGTMLP